jgi:hypothetical protein
MCTPMSLRTKISWFEIGLGQLLCRSKVIGVKLYPQGFRLLAESRRPLLWAKSVGRGIKTRTVLLK